MRNSIFAIPVGLFSIVAIGEGTGASDEAAIREVLQTHYVEAVFVKRDPDLLKAGLAPTFTFHRFWNEEFSNSDTKDWLARMRLDGVASTDRIESRIEVLDRTGVAAIARLELHVNGKLRYTDYFGLYKTKDGWKLVSKTFHFHG